MSSTEYRYGVHHLRKTGNGVARPKPLTIALAVAETVEARRWKARL